MLATFLTALLFADPALVAVQPAGKEPTLRLGGLLQIQAEFGDRGDTRWDNDNDRIFLRRARINARGASWRSSSSSSRPTLRGAFSGTSGSAAAAHGRLSGLEALHVRGRPGRAVQDALRLRAALPRPETVHARAQPGQRSPHPVATAGRPGERRAPGRPALLRRRAVQRLGSPTTPGTTTTVPVRGPASSGVPCSAGGCGGRSRESGWAGTATPTPARSRGSGLLRDAASPTTSSPGSAPETGLDLQWQIGRFDLWLEALRVKFEPEDGLPAPELRSDGWLRAARTSTSCPSDCRRSPRYESLRPRRCGPERRAHRASSWAATSSSRGTTSRSEAHYYRSDLEGTRRGGVEGDPPHAGDLLMLRRRHLADASSWWSQWPSAAPLPPTTSWSSRRPA